MERRFGIAAFDYWYGYSSCQIDLMLADGIVVDYGSGDKKSMGNSAADKREMDALGEAYMKKKAAEGSVAGKTVSLNDFLKEKV